MTLPDLVYGSHNLTISATAMIGDTEVSEIINFNIAQKTEPKTGPTPQPESFPTTRVAAAMVIVVIVGVGLLICLIKTKNCYM